MLTAKAASIINRPLDGRRCSHLSSIHRVETLSRTGRLPPPQAGTSGTGPCGRAPFPGLRGMDCVEVRWGWIRMLDTRHQLPGAEKGSQYLGVNRWSFLKVRAASWGRCVPSGERAAGMGRGSTGSLRVSLHLGC